MAGKSDDLACAVCGQKQLAPYFRLDNFFYHRCRNCGLIGTREKTPVGAGDDYTGFDLDQYRCFVRFFLLPRYRRALRLIRLVKKSGRLLDIGCGTGEFLELTQEFGYESMGVEPSPTASRIAARKNRVLGGEWPDVRLDRQDFDIVSLWSVLEHVPDPLPFLEKVREILKPDGILVLRVPLADGFVPSLALWIYRLSGGKIRRPLAAVYQTDWHYVHFCLYNRANLGRLLRQQGFKIVFEQKESSFDIRSLKYRLDYLPSNFALRLFVKAGLSLVLILARALGREDEIVVLARKQA